MEVGDIVGPVGRIVVGSPFACLPDFPEVVGLSALPDLAVLGIGVGALVGPVGAVVVGLEVVGLAVGLDVVGLAVVG